MLGVHFFESLCPCEDKMSIKKVFHFWPSEIAASMCGQFSLDGPYQPCALAAIAKCQKWKAFLIPILVKKSTLPTCSILQGLEQPPSHMWETISFPILCLLDPSEDQMDKRLKWTTVTFTWNESTVWPVYEANWVLFKTLSYSMKDESSATLMLNC